MVITSFFDGIKKYLTDCVQGIEQSVRYFYVVKRMLLHDIITF